MNSTKSNLVLEVKRINKSFETGFIKKPKTILKEVSFEVPKGITCGFIGNNGSGKTTTIKTILNFIKQDSGEVLFFGKTLSTEAKSKIGYLPERPYLYDFMNSLQYLKYHWDLLPDQLTKGKNFEKKAKALLEKVKLSNDLDKPLRTYSKGMLQRIGLAQALLNDPELLILDEPMSGLDPDGRYLVKEIIKQEQNKGVTVFFSSHLLQDMEQLCSQIVVIHEGQILYSDSLQEFMLNFKTLEEAFHFSKGQSIILKTGKENEIS